jgi:Tfp pilus assembly protein PilF
VLERANANYLRGNYDRADDYLIDYGLVDSLEGLLLSSQISWDRGNQIAAISKMESSLQRFPNATGCWPMKWGWARPCRCSRC